MSDYTITGIPDDEYEALRIICIKKKESVKDVIVKLISEYVKKYKK